MKRLITVLIISLAPICLFCQDANSLLKEVRTKLEKVNDYAAKGILKTNVAFIKAPLATVNIYYKKPDKMKIVNKNGISFIPKGSANINLNSFLMHTENYEVIDAGKEPVTGFRILKLLPTDENADIVLSTLYIDEAIHVIRKSKNTTRDNGTYELEMNYSQFADYGLPDKIIFTFNTKDYKLPKGVTFDYDDGSKKTTNDAMKNKKGKVEITYSSYSINKGVNDKIFNQE